MKKKYISSSNLLFLKGWFESKKQVTLRSKVKSIIIALILGISFAFIIMTITTGDNPFYVFKSMVMVALSPSMFDYTLGIVSLLMISGLANAVAFKTGLFNIGVTGQMFFTGAITVVLGLTVFKSLGVMGVVILIWLGAIIGGVVAGFTGWLKAKFNVHEVVSSILSNWALFYLARYMISELKGSISSASGATKVLPPEFQISQHYYGFILFAIGLIIVLIVSVILWKSTLGHAMKITGLSPNAAKYGGINVNKQIIISMSLSGLIAGILGVMFFVIQERQIGVQYLSYNNLPLLGFQGIAIALLAYSNPIGIIPIAFIFGIFQSGSYGLVEYGIDNSFSNLIIGVMMYFSAISILFMRFKPIRMIYTLFKINKRTYPKEFSKIYNSEKKMLEDYEQISNDNRIKWATNISSMKKSIIEIETKISLDNNELNKQKLLNKKYLIMEEIRENKININNIKIGFKNIKNLRRTKIRLFKFQKQNAFYDRTHFNDIVKKSDEYIDLKNKYSNDLIETQKKIDEKLNKEVK